MERKVTYEKTTAITHTVLCFCGTYFLILHVVENVNEHRRKWNDDLEFWNY